MKKPFTLPIIVIFILIVSSGCNELNKLTPDKVVKQPEKWLHETITIYGVAGTAEMNCTEMGCDPEYPCCNACFGTYALYPGTELFSNAPDEGPYAYQSNGPAVRLEFPEGGNCQGNECQVTCQPLEMGERYKVTGQLLECWDIVPWCTLQVESFESE